MNKEYSIVKKVDYYNDIECNLFFCVVIEKEIDYLIDYISSYDYYSIYRKGDILSSQWLTTFEAVEMTEYLLEDRYISNTFHIQLNSVFKTVRYENEMDMSGLYPTHYKKEYHYVNGVLHHIIDLSKKIVEYYYEREGKKYSYQISFNSYMNLIL